MSNANIHKSFFKHKTNKMWLTSIIISALTYIANARHVCSNAHLRVDVYHENQTSVHYQGNTDLLYSPTAYTLISSAHEAVLVDTPSLAKDGADLASWIARTIPGKRLKYIYITHAHADHFNSFPAVLAHFPDAKVFATKGVKAHMPAQYADPLWSYFWKGLFPSIEKADLSLVNELPADLKFYLEGTAHEFRPIPLGGGDTADSTVLYVPELDLVVGGDVVYGQCYQYLAENPTAEDRQAWWNSLEVIKGLKPRFVVPSHSQVVEDFGAHHLGETQAYIKKWGQWLAGAKTWQELEGLAKKEYPERVGTFILRYTAQSFFNATF
jgi:glyoxylase-like metal-dependent hydrolase (beta-lactamase superfamily II)